MGFPPSLVPYINCEPLRPLPTCVGLGSLLERFMGKQIVVCHLPWTPLLGADRSLPGRFLARMRSYAAHRSPEGDPYGILPASVPQRGPLRLRRASINLSQNPSHCHFVTFGELSAPLICCSPKAGPC
jgi:hypothetical protein